MCNSVHNEKSGETEHVEPVRAVISFPVCNAIGDDTENDADENECECNIVQLIDDRE